MRAIGSGFQSVLFADIRSVEDAKAAVDAVRAETTMAEGVRGRGRLGVGMRRDVGTVRSGGTPAYVDALNEVVIAIMVEKKSCVDDLDRILDVPGLDMVQFGASDFSMSIGRTGQYSDPDVLAAEKKTIETALKKGLHPRVELRDPSQAAKYLDMGVKHYCIGWDVRILADWWDSKGAEMRGLLGGAAAARPRGRRRKATTEPRDEAPSRAAAPVAAHPARRDDHGRLRLAQGSELAGGAAKSIAARSRDPRLPRRRECLRRATTRSHAGLAEDAGRGDARPHQGG